MIHPISLLKDRTMASLKQEHKEQVGKWVADGLGLSDIQKLLKTELGIGMTFMDVRFLVSDLSLQVSAPAKEDKNTAPAPDAPLDEPDDMLGGVSVEVDKVIHPGAAASGSVTFSDGKSTKWFVDPMGQLRIEPPEPGYQPSQEDLQEFQMQLRSALQGPGY